MDNRTTDQLPKASGKGKIAQPKAPEKSKVAQLKGHAAGGLSCGNILFAIGLVILSSFSLSYLTTETLDWGGKSVQLRSYFNKFSPKQFSAEELSIYDGSDPDLPVLLAVSGLVYDVSAGRSHYGPGGGYAFFSGRDASRAYITGCFDTDLTHDLRGLTDDQIKSLKSWEDFYGNSAKYFYVGQVVHEKIPEDAPMPPPCVK